MEKYTKRIINERVKSIVNITDAQAAGIEGNAEVDHLITLKQAINEIKRKGQTAYIIFLDVKKAYDKAWLECHHIHPRQEWTQRQKLRNGMRNEFKPESKINNKIWIHSHNKDN